jgi:myo-inositol-1(or 4)-monophosphatase
LDYLCFSPQEPETPANNGKMDLKDLCFKVQSLVFETGTFIKEERKRFAETLDNVEVKGHSNFVTYVDKSSEERLVKGLSELIPESGFVAEEGTSTKVGDVYNWIIDPLDGTTNFIHGVSPYAISIALSRNGETVLGVVLEITLWEMFYAWEGSPAYLNGKEIHVSKATNHEDSLVVTGFPYYDFGLLDHYLACLKFMMQNTRGVRRLGSAATDLCNVACGRFDAFWEYGLHPWDIAAGEFIIRQAGGKVSDFEGGNEFLASGKIVATNANYHHNFYEIVHQYFGKNGNTETAD